VAHIGTSPTGAGSADARFRRLVERARRKFGYDNCHVCKRPFTGQQTMLIGRLHRGGGIRIVGECCADQLATVIGGGIYVAMPQWLRAIPSQEMAFGPPDALWSADDRRWFGRNPNRSHRLRAALPGEWPDGSSHTIVRQGAPGQRVRLPITASEPLPADDAPEAAAWALFDLVVEHRERGSREIPMGEIIARCRQLGAGGTA
jgi:hypothetical protein